VYEVDERPLIVSLVVVIIPGCAPPVHKSAHQITASISSTIDRHKLHITVMPLLE